MAGKAESIDTSSQTKVILKDPFVGNVSKLVPLLVDHKGPPMRGHLLFDACFEGGVANSLPGYTSILVLNVLLTYCVQGI